MNDVIGVNSSIEEQAKKYYAAFPALSGTSTDSVLNLPVSKENPEVVIEKSAWISGHHLLFDCQVLPLPNDESSGSANEARTTDLVSKERDSMPVSTQDYTQPPFIVPKIQSTNANQAQFNSNLVKSGRPFHPIRKSNEASQPENDAEEAETRVELYQESVKQKQSKEDDEVLAKFIDKFNGNNIASIWNTMFQPNYNDSLLCRITKLKEASFILPRNSQSKSAASDLPTGDTFAHQNRLHHDWFSSNICFNGNCLGKGCFGTDYVSPSSISLLGYYRSLGRSSRKISLTLSENGCDDMSFISQILHETSDDIASCIGQKLSSGIAEEENFENTCQSLESDASTTSLNANLPLSDDCSLEHGSLEPKNQASCLLTSDKTHFRPIRQESMDDDSELHTFDSLSPLKLDQELCSGGTDDDPVGQFKDDPESESRDSWSPDMKDCFPVSQAWPSSCPCYSAASNSSATNTSQSGGTSQMSPLPLDDSPDESKVLENSSWSPLSYTQSTQLSSPLDILRGDAISKKCETPLAIDVSPWHNENPMWADSYSSHQEIGSQDYGNTASDCPSWKYDDYCWVNGIASSANMGKGFDLPQTERQEMWSELWPVTDSANKSKSCDLVEALRDEIKEETEQLLGDIQDMVSKEDLKEGCPDIGRDVDDDVDEDALCEWMMNVEISQVPIDSKALPQLKTNVSTI